MKLACSSAILAIVGCLPGSSTIVDVPVGAGSFGSSSQRFDIDGDGATDLTFSGRGVICTTDVPTSACSWSVSILGEAHTEFLMDPLSSNFATALENGQIVDGSSNLGTWGNPTTASISIAYREYPLAPETSGYRAELEGRDRYSIGFRVQVSEGTFQYGWIDVSLNTPVIDQDGIVVGSFSAPRILVFHYENQADEPIPVQVVPEPSLLHIMICASIGGILTRRNRPHHSAT